MVGVVLDNIRNVRFMAGRIDLSMSAQGTLRVATNCFFTALNWITGKLPVVTGSYVSFGVIATQPPVRVFPALIWRLVRPERFELPTTWFEAKYSIQMSYGRGKARFDHGLAPE